MFIEYKEIVKIYLADIYDKYVGGMTFKVEINKNNDGYFFVDLYQRSLYSLRPNGESEDVIADESLWIWASHLLLNDEKAFNSIEECLDEVNNSFHHHFHLENLDEE